MRVFFAMDLMGGKAVRLLRGDFEKVTVYSEQPLDMIAEMRRLGARDFHIIDLDGARTGARVHADLIKGIRGLTGDYMEVGGGIRTDADILFYEKLGVDGIIVGTRALSDLSFFPALTSPGRVVLGLDMQGTTPMAKGWTEAAGLTAEEILGAAERAGVRAVLYTSIGRDGTLEGPDYEGIRQVQKMTSLPLIASGGVSTIDDLARLKDMGAWASIVGKAFYEGRIQIEEAMGFAD
jgi:phosphoribosylformimino-5-aminoimidazole carboxamide ribotide isomerase